MSHAVFEFYIYTQPFELWNLQDNSKLSVNSIATLSNIRGLKLHAKAMSYTIQVATFASYKIVESTCWHYANGCTWSGLSPNDPLAVLQMNGSGTSGTLRFMNDSGDAFLILVGVHNYKLWCDIVTDLKPGDTGMKIHPTYYAHGERSGIALVDHISKVNAQGKSISLELESSQGNKHSYAVIVQ